MVPAAAGMLNAIGLQNVGVAKFISEKLPALRAYRTPIIANVFGRTVAGIRRGDPAPGIRRGPGRLRTEHLLPQRGLRRHSVRQQPAAGQRSCVGGEIGRRPAAALGQAIPAGDRYRPDRHSRRRSRSRRLDRSQHLSGDEHRFSDAKIATGQPNRRALRPGHQAHHPATGKRSVSSRARARSSAWAASIRPRTSSNIWSRAQPPCKLAPPALPTPRLANASWTSLGKLCMSANILYYQQVNWNFGRKKWLR